MNDKAFDTFHHLKTTYDTQFIQKQEQCTFYAIF